MRTPVVTIPGFLPLGPSFLITHQGSSLLWRGQAQSLSAVKFRPPARQVGALNTAPFPGIKPTRSNQHPVHCGVVSGPKSRLTYPLCPHFPQVPEAASDSTWPHPCQPDARWQLARPPGSACSCPYHCEFPHHRRPGLAGRVVLRLLEARSARSFCLPYP